MSPLQIALGSWCLHRRHERRVGHGAFERASGGGTERSVAPLGAVVCVQKRDSIDELNRAFKTDGENGWELTAISVEMSGGAIRGFDYCEKRPLAEPAPPRLVPPSEAELAAVLEGKRALLTACRDTYARNVTQIALQVTIMPSGRVQTATAAGVDAAGQFANCVQGAVKQVTLQPYTGAPATLNTTLGLARGK